MLWNVCKSKIHGATVTETKLQYEGSITIDEELMKAARLVPYERVQIVNLNNGSRMETFVIPGGKEVGVIRLNGPAARLGVVGDVIHIISYGFFSDEELKAHRPAMVHVDKNNRLAKKQRA